MKTRKTDDQEFDQFWSEYPRREGTSKAKTLAAYRKARRTASAAEILIGLRVYPFSPEVNYQPHAVTWLNQRRYEQHTNVAPPRVALAPTPPSRTSWLSKFDDLCLPFGCTPAARRTRMDADDQLTIDVQAAGD